MLYGPPSQRREGPIFGRLRPVLERVDMMEQCTTQPRLWAPKPLLGTSPDGLPDSVTILNSRQFKLSLDSSGSTDLAALAIPSVITLARTT